MNGSVPLLKANWLFHLNTLRKFVSNGRFFLAKVVWDALAEPARTDALEYGFASYVLGADGQYALFQPAYNFITWATDPIVSAPLGAVTGAAAPVSGFQPSAYVYGRTFATGVVYVNAGTGTQSVPVPSGNWRDARRGSKVTKKVTIPSGGARILVKESGKPPRR